MGTDIKIVMGFICKFVDKSIFDYFSEVNFEMLLCLFYIKVYRVNFSDLYKDFYISENDVFAVLFLIISIVIESVFAFII